MDNLLCTYSPSCKCNPKCKVNVLATVGRLVIAADDPHKCSFCGTISEKILPQVPSGAYMCRDKNACFEARMSKIWSSRKMKKYFGVQPRSKRTEKKTTMKTSTFLTKVLNKFHDGKSYTTTPKRLTWKNSVYSANSMEKTTAERKGRTNLAGMITKVAEETGVKTTKAKLAICNSLGHTSFEKFATSKNVKFSQVKAILQSAIRQSRENGD